MREKNVQLICLSKTLVLGHFDSKMTNILGHPGCGLTVSVHEVEDELCEVVQPRVVYLAVERACWPRAGLPGSQHEVTPVLPPLAQADLHNNKQATWVGVSQ